MACLYVTQTGIVVSSLIVCCKASDSLCNFWGKSERTKANVIFRWLKSHSLKYCMGTHETQRSPVEAAADALDFMQHSCPKDSEHNCNPKFIINMDQTPISFTCHSKKHWNGKEQNQ